ncbi:hypothetical protein GCM10007086_26880 [Photobacterium aphoticum]|nr:hypothetical protein GCM10007086_26880 [Photobacterium aphoticum]
MTHCFECKVTDFHCFLLLRLNKGMCVFLDKKSDDHACCHERESNKTKVNWDVLLIVWKFKCEFSVLNDLLNMMNEGYFIF